MKPRLFNGRWMRLLPPPPKRRPEYPVSSGQSLDLNGKFCVPLSPWREDYDPALIDHYNTPLAWLLAWEAVEQRYAQG